jgi:hypothetical protein
MANDRPLTAPAMRPDDIRGADPDAAIGVERNASSASPSVKDRSAWEVGRAPVADAHDRLFAQIQRLGLERHVVELEIFGFTVLPPSLVGQPGLAERLRAAVLAVAERHTGVTADLETGAGYGERQAPLGRGLFVSNLLFEDPIFEQALMNEPSLTIVTYMLGEHCILNQQSMMVKGPGGDGLSLHADTIGLSAPFPYVAQVANATWALTDYTVDNGCLAVVRGSHHHCRQPTPAENDDRSLWHPVEAPAGSMIVWHGNLWHGAFPRMAPGLRLSISNYFARWAIAAQDRIRDRVTEAMLARNPRRFAYLAGLGHPSFFREDGLNNTVRHSPFDDNRFAVDGPGPGPGAG